MATLAPRNGLVARLSSGTTRFTALPLGSKIALAFLVLISLAAILAPVLAPHDPLASGIPARPPSAENLFGTDRLGRDIFSRLLFGARSSLLIGIGSVALALVIGGLLGALAATSAKWANETIMRIMDMLMAFPGIALAAALLASLGNSLPVIILAIAVIYVPQIARVVRANVLAQWGEDYVRAERVIGAGRFYILGTHVLRNCAAPVLVFATVMVADAIILEASLSFLGAGIQDPAPSWGNVIAYGRTLVLNGAWWATTFAGLTILLTVLALNILAEGMTDALVNPKSTRKSASTSETAAAKAAKPAVDTAALERLRGELALLSETESRRTDRLSLDTARGGAEGHPRGQEPLHPLPGPLRRHPDRGQRLLHGARGRNHGPGRRIRLRQVDHLAGDHGAAARHREDHRLHQVRRTRNCCPRDPTGSRWPATRRSTRACAANRSPWSTRTRCPR